MWYNLVINLVVFMNKIIIKKISWDRIYLNIELDNKLEKDLFLIWNNKKFKILDEYINENKINIPITCAYDDKMIEEGSWNLLYDDEIIKVDLEEAKTLESKDKVFFYGANNYAYIVTFGIDDEFSLIIKINYMKKNLKPNANKSISRKIINEKNIVIYLTKVMFFPLNILYRILSFFRIKKGNKILFMSETRNRLEGNLLALSNRLKERKLDKNFKLYYSFKKVLQEKKSIIYYLRLVNLISKVDYIFVDDYAPSFTYLKLKKTKLIQLWHAGVGFKSVGYSRFGKEGSPHPINSSHRKYDYAVVASPHLIPVYSEVFGLTKKHFLAPGMLRLDGYLNEEKINNIKDKLTKLYPIIKGKQVILFAPTYRGKGQKDAYYDYDKIDMEKLYNTCKNNGYCVLFKLHPFIKEKIKIKDEYSDLMIDASDYIDINELFYITNILITDYSSNIYEYSLFERPMIFFDYDLDEYAISRGVHNSLEDSPGNICRTFDELIGVLNNKKFDIDKVKDFKEKNVIYDSNNLACDKLISELLGR